jgi:EF-P beta-lysylation protein EpmB
MSEVSWQKGLSDLITDPKELITLLELDPALLEAANAAVRLFPLKVTRELVARMEKGNPNDPLLQQIFPIASELIEVPGYESDPLKENQANPIPGLLHKYENRVLITLTSACGVNCRFCFRRHFPYEENNPGRRGWEKMIAYIKEHQAINEVILSGGDPLSVSDKLLKQFSDQLTAVSHIKRLRIHTRLPIVLPTRVTDELIAWIQQLKFAVIIVIHMNHPNEMTESVQIALQRLRNAGATLFNQSVLLKGVNADVDTLIALSETLFAAGVLPYYLHVLDKVQGAAHFDLPLKTAKKLHAEISKHLPGYLVPKLVREDAGEFAKTLL